MARKTIPARTPQGRENQLINLAMKLAEEKLLNGTASSQIITTIINWGTMKHQLENDKLRSDLDVARAKIAALESQQSSADKYDAALKAFRSYQGNGYDPEEDDEYYEEY